MVFSRVTVSHIYYYMSLKPVSTALFTLHSSQVIINYIRKTLNMQKSLTYKQMIIVWILTSAVAAALDWMFHDSIDVNMRIDMFVGGGFLILNCWLLSVADFFGTEK